MIAPELVRLPDWEARLSRVVEQWRDVPYRYGRADCACLAQAAVLALTGVELMPGADKPKGWLAAAKWMIRHGFESVEDMATQLLGPPLEAHGNAPQRTAFARRGDIVSFEACGEPHLAVVVGQEAVTPSEHGLARVPMSAWVKAWRVG